MLYFIINTSLLITTFNLRMLLYKSSTPHTPSSLLRSHNPESEDLRSARPLVRKVLEESLLKLQKEDSSPRLPIRWELGACWVQHLQNQASGKAESKNTEEEKVEPTIKGLGKHGGLLKKSRRKHMRRSLILISKRTVKSLVVLTFTKSQISLVRKKLESKMWRRK